METDLPNNHRHSEHFAHVTYQLFSPSALQSVHFVVSGQRATWPTLAGMQKQLQLSNSILSPASVYSPNPLGYVRVCVPNPNQ